MLEIHRLRHVKIATCLASPLLILFGSPTCNRHNKRYVAVGQPSYATGNIVSTHVGKADIKQDHCWFIAVDVLYGGLAAMHNRHIIPVDVEKHAEGLRSTGIVVNDEY
jgi:hypothetical protein